MIVAKNRNVPRNIGRFFPIFVCFEQGRKNMKMFRPNMHREPSPK
jgi:hypothetical protein